MEWINVRVPPSPLPQGTGQGEGKLKRNAPHPIPLPKGEGVFATQLPKGEGACWETSTKVRGRLRFSPKRGFLPYIKSNILTMILAPFPWRLSFLHKSLQ